MSNEPEQEPQDQDQLAKLVRALKQQRDELALRMHLAKAEAKEEWGKLEDKWAELSAEYEPIKGVVGDTAKGVVRGLSEVAHELKVGFDRVRKLL